MNKSYNKHTICRYKNRRSAVAICDMMNYLLADFKVNFERDAVSDSDRKRGVGDWAVYFDDVELGNLNRCSVMSILDRCCSTATQFVLADEVASIYPHHYLLENWVLSPGNRDDVSKYYIRSSSQL